MAFKLPDLPYAKDALAPHMSAETLEFHHGKHHKAYVDKLNELIAGTEFEGLSLEDIIVKTHGVKKHQAIFNNAGQHWNHAQFWTAMKPKGGGKIPGNLEKRIVADLGSVEDLKKSFTENGVGQFGSGWVWLVEADGRLQVTRTANAENPLHEGQRMILVCDVWEHAYYIDYRNERPKFLKTFLEHLVDWEAAAARLEAKMPDVKAKKAQSRPAA
jgi:Fe-Mn family superoxide dismutase